MQYVVKQRVGNIKNYKVGTIVSEEFRGANGEFRGHLISIGAEEQEIWDISVMAALPAGF